MDCCLHSTVELVDRLVAKGAVARRNSDADHRFIIAENDRVISTALEKMEAEAMNAKSIVIPSSHVVMLSHPEAVTEFVEPAARYWTDSLNR